MDTDGLLLGIDPGSSKTGLALVDEEGRIKKQYIAHTANLKNELKDFLKDICPDICVMGDGTRSREHRKLLNEILSPTVIIELDETNSTQEAKVLYWQLNPPTGWRKLIPLGMLIPPVPLDDYAAIILVRRYLQQAKRIQ